MGPDRGLGTVLILSREWSGQGHSACKGMVAKVGSYAAGRGPGRRQCTDPEVTGRGPRTTGRAVSICSPAGHRGQDVEFLEGL